MARRLGLGKYVKVGKKADETAAEKAAKAAAAEKALETGTNLCLRMPCLVSPRG